MSFDPNLLALSIQQPWAWLIVNGYKDVENRTWKTNVRGRVDIHAGKRFDVEGYSYVRRRFPSIPMPAIGEFELGGIVGSAKLLDCVWRHHSPWFFGPLGFVFSEAQATAFVPCRGKLGFFQSGVQS